MWPLKESGDVHVFAGSDREEGSVDGLAKNFFSNNPLAHALSLTVLFTFAMRKQTLSRSAAR